MLDVLIGRVYSTYMARTRKQRLSATATAYERLSHKAAYAGQTQQAQIYRRRAAMIRRQYRQGQA